uniref:mRNA (guanine-N(7))-methyltransferase n=1 Tax=Zea mays TaxID=4577 RepID=C0HFY7_MAIZE|nr:unknown [Zea mays]
MNVAVPPQSPHLRLYDFAKSAIIKIFAFPYATVCYMLLSFMIFSSFQISEKLRRNPESNFTFIGCQMPKVCDLYCDGGMDTDKWCDAQVGHYIGIDASASGVNYARELWENRRKPFTAEFIELDPSDDGFEAQVQEKGIQADMVCCMQHLQASWLFSRTVEYDMLVSFANLYILYFSKDSYALRMKNRQRSF